MPEKTITEIPADPKLNSQRYYSRKLRVAAYCRVSTEEEEQHSSFDAVSYTHLDVYKRQTLLILLISKKR